MKTKTLLLTFFVFGFLFIAFGQKSSLELTFTASYDGLYVPLDSIFIENLTQGGDTTLYAPDTLFVFDIATNIKDYKSDDQSSFSLSQNYPNPFYYKTRFDIFLPHDENITIIIYDLLGRLLVKQTYSLKEGTHFFDFYPGHKTLYFLTVTGKQAMQTFKMAYNNGAENHDNKCTLIQAGYKNNIISFKSVTSFSGFVFNPGDLLRFTGFAGTVFDVSGSDVIEDAPEGNDIYEFEISEGIPCPEMPSFEYEAQVYNTIKIGDQCWMKENLNVGTMVAGISDMEDNGVIEKFCYGNSANNCNTYGGLYQWNETMQYSTVEGAQGICPQGWHIPTDEEYKILEGTVDSQYDYPDLEWDTTWFRGFDAGLNLKSIDYWGPDSNGSDLYGFRGLPGGYRNMWGGFGAQGEDGYFYTSTIAIQFQDASFARGLHGITDETGRWGLFWPQGQSVRCLKD